MSVLETLVMPEMEAIVVVIALGDFVVANSMNKCTIQKDKKQYKKINIFYKKIKQQDNQAVIG